MCLCPPLHPDMCLCLADDCFIVTLTAAFCSSVARVTAHARCILLECRPSNSMPRWADIAAEDDDDDAGEMPEAEYHTDSDLEAWGHQPEPLEPQFMFCRPSPTPWPEALEAQIYCSTLSALNSAGPVQPQPRPWQGQCTTSALAPSQGFDEMRLDWDGHMYTFAEFLNFYGESWGGMQWQNATYSGRMRRTVTIELPEAEEGGGALATLQGTEGAVASASTRGSTELALASTRGPIELASASTRGPAELKQDSLLPPTATTRCHRWRSRRSQTKSYKWGYWKRWAQLPPGPLPAHFGAQPFAAPAAPGPRLGQSESGPQDWKDTHFFLSYLKDQHIAVMTKAGRDVKDEFAKLCDPRRALLLACGELYNYLPLHLIFNGRCLKYSLGVPEALFVTAEVITRVTAGNHESYKCQVDLFAYLPSGHVHRYHPGDRPERHASPCQVLRTDSHLFQIDVATTTGVGSALHLVPPGLASAPSRGDNTLPTNNRDIVAFTPAHQSELIRRDLQLQGKPTKNGRWRLLRTLVDIAAAAIPEGSVELDVTDGKVFPWWLAIAGCHQAGEIIDDGIFKVWVAVHTTEHPHLIVRNTSGFVRVSFNRMGLHIHKFAEKPSSYGPGVIAG